MDPEGAEETISEPPRSVTLTRITTAAWTVLTALVLFGTARALGYGQPPPVITATVVTVAVGLGGVFWQAVVARGRPPENLRRARIMRIVRMTVTGLAGVTLLGLLPNAAGYVLVVMAIAGLGLNLPFTLAIVPAAVLFAGVNLVITVIAPWPSPGDIVGNDVGTAFLFSICAFTRSLRLSQARARLAQARAERLVTQLRAARDAEAKAAILTERTHLAREVHDILAHSLSGLVLALDTAELLGRQDEPASERQAKILEQVARAQRIARDGLADTRRAVSALRGDQLPGPPMLDRLVRETSETAGIRATLTVTGPERPLTPEAGLAVYRTAQEALINSAKYAGRGGRAELRLAYGADRVELEIEDVRSVGRQAPQPTGLTFGGYGLTGIRERAELLGGTLTAGPTRDGFRVLLRLPDASAFPDRPDPDRPETDRGSDPDRAGAVPREAEAL